MALDAFVYLNIALLFVSCCRSIFRASIFEEKKGSEIERTERRQKRARPKKITCRGSSEDLEYLHFKEIIERARKWFCKAIAVENELLP